MYHCFTNLLTFNCFLLPALECSLTPPVPPKTHPTLQNCLERVASINFKRNDVIMEINAKEWFLSIPNVAVLQRNPYNNNGVSNYLLRPQVYMLFTSENEIDNLLYVLYRSTYWNPRAKFVIVYEGDVKVAFEKLFKYFVLNAIVFIEQSSETFNIFSYFPYNGTTETDPVLAGTCTKGFLTSDNDLFPNKLPSSWENFTITYNVNTFYPYVFCLNCSVQGIEIRVLVLLQYMLGFKMELKVLNETERGLMDQNGNWNGLYGQLQNRAVDLILGGFSGSYNNYWQFDMIFPNSQDEAVWLVPVARKIDHWRNIMQIFQVNVWILLLVSMVYSSFGSWIVGE